MLLVDDELAVVGTGKRRFAERSSEDSVILPVGKKDGTFVATTKSVSALHLKFLHRTTCSVRLTIEYCML